MVILARRNHRQYMLFVTRVHIQYKRFVVAEHLFYRIFKLGNIIYMTTLDLVTGGYRYKVRIGTSANTAAFTAAAATAEAKHRVAAVVPVKTVLPLRYHA